MAAFDAIRKKSCAVADPPNIVGLCETALSVEAGMCGSFPIAMFVQKKWQKKFLFF